MKGIGFGVIILTTCLSLVSAEKPYITPVNYPTPTPTGTVVSGVVTNIDPVNQTIQIKESSGMLQTIHLDGHIELERNGNPVSLNTLNLDDSIVVVAR